MPSSAVAAGQPIRVAFYRDFHGPRGGHFKMWHYFNHLLSDGRFAPSVYLTPTSVRDASNPWMTVPHLIQDRWQPDSADVLFLAGLDWNALEKRDFEAYPPVINLVQSVRHGDSRDPRYRFLTRKALRICVSPQVEDVLRQTGICNGPIVTIPNGIDVEPLSEPVAWSERPIDCAILGLKHPALAKGIEARLAAKGMKVINFTQTVPRPDFLRTIANSKVCLGLPQHFEGFYLPALEAMALGTLVVCPDCNGNRSFCIDGVTCIMPDYDPQALVAATERALSLSEEQRDGMIARAAGVAAEYSMERERTAFLAIVTDYLGLAA